MIVADIENIGFEPVDIGKGYKAYKFRKTASYLLVHIRGQQTLISREDLINFMRYINNPTPEEIELDKMIDEILLEETLKEKLDTLK